MMSEQATEKVERTHPVDEVLPLSKLTVYGLQHVLAFYAGAVLNPILIATGIGLPQEQLAYLISANLFMCGIATLMQTNGFWKVGIRMPIVQGITTTAVGPSIAVGLAAGGGVKGLPTLFGAVIVAGLLTFLLAPYISRLIRFFPPVVTGSIITIIGIYLVPIAALKAGGGDPSSPDFASFQNLALAFGTLGLITAIYWFFRGFVSTIAILIGLVVGTIAAAVFGVADFSQVGKASWVGVTTPLHFGWPTFEVTAILTLILVMLITAVECVGQYFAIAKIVGKDIEQADIARGIRADGLATAIGGFMNAFPTTVYSQNVGLLRLSNIKSRWVVTAAGIIMIVLGALPKVGAIVGAIPSAVLGGAALVLFSTIAVVGIQILTQADLSNNRNLIIVAISLAMGIIPSSFPEFYKNVPFEGLQMVIGNGIIMGSLTAIVLNILFNHVRGEVPPVRTELEEAALETSEALTGDSPRSR